MVICQWAEGLGNLLTIQIQTFSMLMYIYFKNILLTTMLWYPWFNRWIVVACESLFIIIIKKKIYWDLYTLVNYKPRSPCGDMPMVRPTGLHRDVEGLIPLLCGYMPLSLPCFPTTKKKNNNNTNREKVILLKIKVPCNRQEEDAHAS